MLIIRFVLLFLWFLVLMKPAFASTCHGLYNKKVTELSSENFSDLIANPNRNIGKIYLDARGRHGTPFTVIPKKSLPYYIRKAIHDIELLSERDYLREMVFGHAHKNLPLSTGLLDGPLNFKNQANDQQGFFVEVGVDIFTLKDGRKLYIYTTSNTKNSLEVDYGFISDVIHKIKEAGGSVIALDTFHTHPINLVPSIEDKLHYQNELLLVKKSHPELDFRNWKMGTTMDTQSVIHRVDLRDWL